MDTERNKMTLKWDRGRTQWKHSRKGHRIDVLIQSDSKDTCGTPEL
jgi:hypothetical protein